MLSSDTIVAISSAVGPSARMIVRLSGPEALEIARRLAVDPTTHLQRLCFAGLTSPAAIYAFGVPRSVTGEDVAEFHIPGNPLLARMLLEELIHRGARQADAGEFTARAYFNGKIDLSEAEGVAATIAAQSERQLLAARQLAAGELARRLDPIMNRILQTLALVEAGIDFSDEDISFIQREQLLAHIDRALAELADLLDQSTRFEQLSHEPRVVLIGRPNAGKSTLLNALADEQRAVVSRQAGTTRDAIWASVRLARGMVRIVDVAGIEQGAHSTDEIAIKMQEAAQRAQQTADVIVLVHDASDDLPPIKINRSIDLAVNSKIDLESHNIVPHAINVSAVTGEGLAELRDRLDGICFGDRGGGTTLAMNARHVECINEAVAALRRADNSVDAGLELLAMELRESLDALGRILGVVTPDDLLGRIFSAFCIGK